MPELQKIYTLTITPEQFLEACSATELYELSMLLQGYRYQRKMMQGDFVQDPVPEMPTNPLSQPESLYPEKPQFPQDRIENTAGWKTKYGQE